MIHKVKLDYKRLKHSALRHQIFGRLRKIRCESASRSFCWSVLGAKPFDVNLIRLKMGQSVSCFDKIPLQIDRKCERFRQSFYFHRILIYRSKIKTSFVDCVTVLSSFFLFSLKVISKHI